MNPPSASLLPPTANAKYHEASVRRLPAAARAAFARFQASDDPADLDPVLRAVLEDFVPRTPARPLAGLPGTARLIEDFGFDSLSITEMVFFAEDLFGITISNEEILQVHTLDELRGFIHGKVSARGVH